MGVEIASKMGGRSEDDSDDTSPSRHGQTSSSDMRKRKRKKTLRGRNSLRKVSQSESRQISSFLRKTFLWSKGRLPLSCVACPLACHLACHAMMPSAIACLSKALPFSLPQHTRHQKPVRKRAMASSGFFPPPAWVSGVSTKSKRKREFKCLLSTCHLLVPSLQLPRSLRLRSTALRVVGVVGGLIRWYSAERHRD